MPNIVAVLRTYIFRGLLASIPIFLSYLAVKFIVMLLVQSRVIDFAEDVIGYKIPGLSVVFGIFLVLMILCFLGVMASNVLGRRLFRVIESITKRIPILNTVYHVGKQVSMALSLPGKQVFKKAVLVEVFRQGVWLIGFVTGDIEDPRKNEKLLKVFIPTVPNPTSGFLVHVNESQIIDPGWTLDEAMRAVISVGIIGPEAIGRSGMSKMDIDGMED